MAFHKDFFRWVFLCIPSALVLCQGGVNTSLVYAENWQPRMYNAALPPRVVAVDKSQQQFYLYDEKETDLLSLTHNYPCTTGQIVGDKQKVNDLRTPEGVYFVVYKIAKGLDFKEYGGIAYTLNYPNPVDKLRGKTGYGIWIHSKGDGISPLITKGCIAIGLEEIAEVGPLLTSGTAVVVGETLNTAAAPIADDGTVEHLRRRMEQWTHAWANRSQDFFDFYNGDSYTKAMPETFQAFRSNKERLFKRLAWINIFNRDVHVLEGPGYWVTWSEQFYRAPNLSTEGIRRLYWQRDTDNVFRIVGMEWIPSNLGMQAAFEKGELVASTGQVLDASAGLSVTGTKEEKPTAPPISMPESDSGSLATGTDTAIEGSIVKTQESIVLTTELRALVQSNVHKWLLAWHSRDSKAFYAFYNEQRYGKEAGQNYTNAFVDLKNIMAPYFKTSWLEMLNSEPVMQVVNDMVLTSVNQWIFIPGQKPRQGAHLLYWKKDSAQQWRIVASEWKESVGVMQVAYLEKVSAEIDVVIAGWRKAWLAGDVDAYLNYYASNASQGGRNKSGIGVHKKRVWQKNPPAKIELTGMRVLIVENGIQVDMTQVYADKNGRGDKGTKTLLFVPTPQGWKISKEDWSATSL